MYEEDIDSDIETEEYQEEEQENPISEDLPQFAAPRIMSDTQHLMQYSQEFGPGMSSTTAEGEFGRKLRRMAKAGRTDEERLWDNLVRASRALGYSDFRIIDALKKYFPRIPDLKYKNPAGLILGFLLKDYLNKSSLTKEDEKKIKEVLDKIKTIREQAFKISSLDVVRYAKLWNRILGRR